MPKIFMIADNLKGGGTERRMIETIRGLINHGYKIQLVILNMTNEYPEIENIGIKIFRIKRFIKKDPTVVLKLYKICKVFKPDIIHSWGTMASVYAVPIKLILRTKFINAMITNAKCNRFSSRWWRSRLTFPFSDFILSNSHAGLIAYKAPLKKAAVIYNGFNFNRTKNLLPKDKMKMKLGIEDDFIVGMVAMVDYRKDYDTFIEAAIKIHRKHANITFVCVGSGPDLETMLDKTVNLSFIRFVGRQNNIESIINIFKIGVLATNNNRHREGISNSILEYMALGIPAIATEGGGTNEIITDGQTGFLIPPSSPEKLAERILQLYQNERMLSEMGENGKNKVLNSFNHGSMIDSLQQVYHQVLS